MGVVEPLRDGPEPDRRAAEVIALLLLRLLLVVLLWSGLALGKPVGSSSTGSSYDLLSEAEQLLEVEDLSLALLQGGRMGATVTTPRFAGSRVPGAAA